jgi:transposase
MNTATHGNDTRVYLGIDVAKEIHFAFAINSNEEEVYQGKVRQDEKELELLFEKLNKENNLLIVIDQPKNIGSLIVRIAKNLNIDIKYVSALSMRRYAQSMPNSAKTDRIDARYIALMALRQRESLLDVKDTTKNDKDLSILLGRDEDLAKDSTKEKNRLRHILIDTSPSFERILSGSKLYNKLTLDLLSTYGSIGNIKKIGKHKLSIWAKDKKHRNFQKLLDKIFSTPTDTKNSFDSDILSDTIKEIASSIKSKESKREEIAKHIQELTKDNEDVQILKSIPGFSTSSAAKIKNEIGNLDRFQSDSCLAAYSGVAPINVQSGTSIHYVKKSRAGNKILKNALFYGVFSALRSDEKMRKYYDEQKAKKRHHTSILTSLSRKRVRMIYTMLKNKTYYDKNYEINRYKLAA